MVRLNKYTNINLFSPISGSEELVNFIGKNSNLEILKNATHTMKEENDLLQFKNSLCDFLNKI